jgi:dTDP-4-dehydrorhamnose 3,5-epimerase
MHVEKLSIPDVLLITPRRHGDQRGFFSETFRADLFRDLGLDATFVQDNHSRSSQQGVLRGLHFQTPPQAQGKLVRCIRGSIFDVAVDIRKGSPSYGRHVSSVISARNWTQVWVPAGFAHGFCTLEPDCEVIYKVTDYYAPELEVGIAFDDPALAIPWPVPAAEVILSPKDRTHPPLSGLGDHFVYAR